MISAWYSVGHSAYDACPASGNTICLATGNADVRALCISSDMTVSFPPIGGKDTVISDEMHNALTSAFPVAKQIVFPDAGHASYAECPTEYHAEIIKFVSKTKQ